MTATDELRRLLDERGVEWTSGDTEVSRNICTDFCPDAGVSMSVWENDGKLGIDAHTLYRFTPAQAIAATLGSDRLAFLEEKVRLQGDYIIKLTKEYDALFAQSCEAATRHAGQIDAMQRKLEAATLGAGTCHAIISDNLNESEGMGDAWADCSECGHLLFVLTDPNSEPPNFYPNCGRRVVEVDE